MAKRKSGSSVSESHAFPNIAVPFRKLIFLKGLILGANVAAKIPRQTKVFEMRLER
jgi:hypothetical protein